MVARVGLSRLPNHTVRKQQEGRRATIREALAPDMPGACQQGPPRSSQPPSPLQMLMGFSLG